MNARDDILRGYYLVSSYTHDDRTFDTYVEAQAHIDKTRDGSAIISYHKNDAGKDGTA
jgi:hypothetical protein